MCNCSKCGWRFFTDAKRAFECPECGIVVECDGVELPERSVWPRWAIFVKGFRKDGEVGVGDTVERLLGEGGKWFKKFMKDRKIDCGCAARQKRWNTDYPY